MFLDKLLVFANDKIDVTDTNYVTNWSNVVTEKIKVNNAEYVKKDDGWWNFFYMIMGKSQYNYYPATYRDKTEKELHGEERIYNDESKVLTDNNVIKID